MFKIGSTMVLARLLVPADFGLVAMVTAVTGFAAMFKDAGLSSATVQRAKITHEQVSTLFWVNVALSVGIMMVVAALAPAIAWFYKEPRLVGITLVLAGSFIFSGLTIQHQALLRRQMRFSALAMIEIGSMAVGVGVAITMAILGSGYWSLVGMTVGMSIANFVFAWIALRWRPGRPARGSGVMPMLAFGSWKTGAGLANYGSRNADNVIIGSMMGSASLGIYSKAYQLILLPISQINAPIAAVMLPALSRLQDNPERFRRMYLRVIQLLALISFPLVAVMAIEARRIVLLVLGDQWLESVDVFRWLLPAALVSALNVAPGWLFVSTGRTKAMFWTATAAAVVTVGAFLIGARFGLEGVAIGCSAAFTALFIPRLFVASHTTPVNVQHILMSLAPGCILALISCLPVALMEYLAPTNAAWMLPAAAVLFAVSWVAGEVILGRVCALPKMGEISKTLFRRTPSLGVKA